MSVATVKAAFIRARMLPKKGCTKSGHGARRSTNAGLVERGASHMNGDVACGFASQSYFSRSFREQFGVTPRVWRAGRAEGADTP